MRTKQNRVIPSGHITVPEFAKTVTNRRGYPISPSYIYKLIQDGRIHEKGMKAVEFGKEILLTKL